MRKLAEHAYYSLCLALGHALRSQKYSTVRIVYRDGESLVQKSRSFHAPLLLALGNPLMRILDTGVRVLGQRDWEKREGLLYRMLRNTSIRRDPQGVLLLPQLGGRTLAAWLDDPEVTEPLRQKAVELAVRALREFHRAGYTHGDAMAENVMVDVDADVAHWFDFETVHDDSRAIVCGQADDLRALLATCLLRTNPEQYRKTVDLIVERYADADVTREVAASFASVWQRPLPFHLGQAALPYHAFMEVGTLLIRRRA